MKKIILFVLMSIIVIAFSGCANNDINKPDNLESKVGDYFPMKGNVIYDYEGMGNEYASYTMTIDYTSNTKIQQRINNGGTELVKVIELIDGKAVLRFTRGETYFRENMLNKSVDNDVLLMEPIKKGTKWNLPDLSTREITALDSPVSTPSGNYKAVEVTSTGKDGKTIDYYVKNIGLVKSVFKYPGGDISSALKSVKENVKFNQNVSFFYPNLDAEKIYYKDVAISFSTNDNTKEVLAKAYKANSIPGTGPVFTENTKINKLYMGTKDRLYIDLNRSFLTEMNAGSLYESMILKSMADTFGKYYNAQKVFLTLDGKQYESGHILIEKGSYFTVEIEDAVKAE